MAKHDDHLPLYRQEEIYARSGVHIARSSMAQWIGICGVRLAPLAQALKAFILSHPVVHADETPVALLAPGRGKTKRAYVWVYRTTNFVPQRAVLFDFCTSRGGKHPQRVLQNFSGTLVTDDFSGYHKLQRQGAITGALCMAHARRKLFEAHKLNGHDPWAYLKDVFERLPTLKNRDLELLLPHNWKPAGVPVAPAAADHLLRPG